MINGIKKYTAGRKKLEEEYRKAFPTRTKITEEELNAWSNSGKKSEIMQPIYSKIGEAIVSFTKDKGFVVVFDSSKNIPDKVKPLFKQDVTKEFIACFNECNP